VVHGTHPEGQVSDTAEPPSRLSMPFPVTTSRSSMSFLLRMASPPVFLGAFTPLPTISESSTFRSSFFAGRLVI